MRVCRENTMFKMVPHWFHEAELEFVARWDVQPLTC